jgi:hypothetical protein
VCLDQAARRAGKDRRRRAEGRLGLVGVWLALRTAKAIETAQPAHHEGIVGHAPTRIVKLERRLDVGPPHRRARRAGIGQVHHHRHAA